MKRTSVTGKKTSAEIKRDHAHARRYGTDAHLLPQISIRLPIELIDRIDEWSKAYARTYLAAEDMPRQTAIRILLEAGLDSTVERG